MSNEPEMIELEMDNPTSLRTPAADLPDAIALDMMDSSGDQRCVDCNATQALDEQGRCSACVVDLAPADPTSALAAIVAESTGNASINGIGSLRSGQMRGVGFSNKEGYIQAIRNGVPGHTHSSYLTTLRAQYGLTTADIAALNLPGPMVETALPVGPGIVHMPAPGSVPFFDRPASQRKFMVGPQSEAEQAPVVKLEAGNLVAGAVAEGHGVMTGWRGLGQMTRAALSEALASVEMTELLPAPMSARAQAGQAVGRYNGLGYVVRVARKAKDATWAARWTIGAVKSENKAGESYGDIVLAVELSEDGTLTFDGDQAMADSILADYQSRISSEVYQAGDITAWLNRVLHKEYLAVDFALGLYIRHQHAAKAEALLGAVMNAGWGRGWGLPAIPVADSDQLRDGIVRGLQDEVAGVMQRLETEREVARTERKAGDIGERRAGSFLKELRSIGTRIAAYGAVLGEDRVAKCRETVRLAVVSLETLLGDDYSGIGARFAGIFEELELDAKRNGTVL